MSSVVSGIETGIHYAERGKQAAEDARHYLQTGTRAALCVGGAALVAFGLKRRSLGGLGAAAFGGDLIYRGLNGEGHLHDVLFRDRPQGLPYGRGVKLKTSLLVNKPAGQLYRLWRNFENLPCFMSHVEDVQVIDSQNSHWIVRGPAKTTVEWDAEVIADRPNELIGWRSKENAEVDHAGSVRFQPAQDGRTMVTVALQYNPPAGTAGANVSKFLGIDPRRQIREDLSRFKRFAESADLDVLDRLLQRRQAS